MSTSTSIPALDNTMGVLFLSAILSMALWGCACVQLYYYFDKFARDAWWIKALVFAVWSSDTVSQALINQVVYTYLISNYANVLYLAHLERTLLPIMLLTGILSLGVQSFFIMRIWRLSNKNYYLTGLVSIVVLAQFVSTCVFFGKSARFTTFAQLQPENNFMHEINAISAASDALIAIIVSFLLHRSRSGFKRTETIINRLIIFTINTGVLTGICAIMTLICNVAFPGTFIYMIFYILVARVYTNSLLATLNTRDSFRSGLPDSTSGTPSVPLDRIRMRNMDGEATSKHYNPHTVSIKVDTETVRDGPFKRQISSDMDLEASYQEEQKAQAF